MKEKIREILMDIRPDVNFDASDNFWEDELLDSMDIMELINALELEYKIEIGLEYVKGSYFSGYETIEALVKQELKNAL